MPTRQRPALVAFGLALAAAVAWPAPAVAQDPSTAPEILVEVRIENGPSRVVFARLAGDRLHVAGPDVLELAGAEILRAARDTLFEFRLRPTDTPTLVATRGGYLQTDGTRTALPGWSATWIDGVLYFETSLLEQLLGVSATVDLTGLSVLLRATGALPAVAAAGEDRGDAGRAELFATPELLLEVRFERGPRGLVLARALDDRTWLSAAQVLQLAEIRITRMAMDTTLAFVLEPQGTRVEIDTRRGSITRDGTARVLAPLDALWIDGTPYVELGLLATLLDVGASVNLGELTVSIRSATHIPAVARTLREARRARLRPDGRLARESGLPVRRGAALVGGAVLDWAAQLATTAPAGPGGLRAESGAVQLGFGMGLFGGSALVIHEERWLPQPIGNTRQTDASWTRAWPTSHTVRQVRLGEVSGTGRQPRQLRGGAITNAPYVRPATFAGGVLRGTLPAGWEVELYRQGALVGVSTVDPDGHYAFDVPLVYGTNPVELVAYGPTGELRRFARTFEVPFERLPAGQFEYGIGGGGCDLDPCQATGNLDLRYGATRAITLRLGWDQFWRDTLPDLWHPYGSATIQATRSLALFGEVVGNAQLGGMLAFAPTPNLHASVGHTHFVGDSVVQPLVGSVLLDDLTVASFYLRPGLLSRRLYLRADGRRSVGPFVRRHDGQITLTLRAWSARLDAGVRVVRSSIQQSAPVTRTTLSAQALYQMGPAFGPLRRTILRAGVEVDPDPGLTRVVAGFARTLLHDYYLSATVTWDRDLGVIANVGFKANLPSLRFTSQNRVDDFGAVGLQSAEGSLMYDGDGGRLALGNGRGIGRAGVTGTVYLDRNGNGVRDPAEPPLPGVLIHVGPWVARADENGRYTIWDVVPFETLLIEVDPGSAADPQWVPTNLRYVLNPDPNQFVPVDIPFVPTVEVMGEVRQASDGALLPGVEITLEPVDGSTPYTARTFADGAFYLMGVRPGVYRVTIAPRARETLALDADEQTIEITAGRTTPVEGIVIRVRPSED